MNKLTGSCHCGNIKFELNTNKTEEDLLPRTCQCSLCKKHDASWISDPKGSINLHYKKPDQVSSYRFGTATADFIICRECGVLTLALCEDQGKIRAVSNIKSMLNHAFSSTPMITNFDGETVEERLARRRENWTGEVIIGP